MLQRFGDIDDGGAEAAPPEIIRRVKATKQSPQDLAAVKDWAALAPVGAEKEIQASSADGRFIAGCIVDEACEFNIA